MGWFKNLFELFPSKVKTQYIEMMTGNAPIYSQFGTNIYASDVVQTCIDAIATEMSKIIPKHVRMQGTDPVPVGGNIQYVLDNPNQFITWSEFIEKCVWLRELNYNVFIFKSYEKTSQGRRLVALYPLQPIQVDILEAIDGRIAYKFRFVNGYESTVYASEIIHWKKRFSVNEFMGGNHDGQPDTKALLQTLQLNHELLQGVAKAMKASYAVSGVVKYKTMLDDGTIQKNIVELEKKLNENKSGLMGVDISSEVIPFKRDVKMVDEPTLKFIDDKILRFYRTPIGIIRGDYTKETYESWYQSRLEPDINSLQQVMTKSIFSDTAKTHGNQIQLYVKELIFMNTTQKLEMVRLLGDSGAMFENEKRTIFGLPPIPELAGQRKQSLNYVDVNIAAEYQVGGTPKEESPQEDDSEDNKEKEDEANDS